MLINGGPPSVMSAMVSSASAGELSKKYHDAKRCTIISSSFPTPTSTAPTGRLTNVA